MYRLSEYLKTRIIKKRLAGKNEGYTLIELLIILAVAGILLSAIMTFFITNFRNFNRETDDLHAQNQANKAMEFLTEKIIETSGNIETIGTDITITFTVSFERSSPHNGFIAFHFNEANQILSFGSASSRLDAINDATSASHVVAEQISDFFIDHQIGSRIKTITIESTMNNNVIKLESKVSYRNWKLRRWR